MRAIVQITHKQLNDLANVCKDAHQATGITLRDTDGYVQAAAVFDLNDNDFEGLHNAVKQMGADSIMFITDCGVVMESSVHDCRYIPVGFWTEVTKQIAPVGDVYHIDGKHYFINVGE